MLLSRVIEIYFWINSSTNSGERLNASPVRSDCMKMIVVNCSCKKVNRLVLCKIWIDVFFIVNTNAQNTHIHTHSPTTKQMIWDEENLQSGWLVVFKNINWRSVRIIFLSLFFSDFHVQLPLFMDLSSRAVTACEALC